MSYNQYYTGGWQSGEVGATPITPEALNNMENGIGNALPKDGTDAMEADLNMGGNKITALGTPTADTDASTKKYVDDGLSGKANSSHDQSASTITSGTLVVARGGTGKATHTSNAVLTGNGTSAVNNVATANGALYATAENGAPVFGTLPFAQGGTEATSRIGAAQKIFSEAVSSPNYVMGFTTSWKNVGYTTIAQLRTALGIKDYVTAQGTSGSWYYRKWNSGRAECWGKHGLQFNANSGSSYNSLYIWDVTFTLPFTFKAVPTVAFAQSEDFYHLHYRDYKSTTSAVGFLFTNHKQFTEVTGANTFVYVVGNWK